LELFGRGVPRFKSEWWLGPLIQSKVYRERIVAPISGLLTTAECRQPLPGTGARYFTT